ncbi:MAG: M48 family metalloprotease [Maribacter arcticus]|uniref:M48 family metalloprotease n=1 Tax=Maribacter arcticus TaxID=561365 RepID=UPI0030018363
MIEICSSQNTTDLLTNSINRIGENIGNDLTEEIPIVISDLNNIKVLFPSNAIPNEFQFYTQILRNGFGITQPKYFRGGVQKHLIVVNTEFIEKLKLSESELDAVIAHELGHIFNKPNRDIPNFIDEQEFYADYFASSIGLKESLLSSITKYLEDENAQNTELFDLRIRHLNEENIFDNGNIRNL